MRARNKSFYLLNLIRLLTDIILIQFVVILAYSVKFKIGYVFRNYFSMQFGKIYSHAQIEPYLRVMVVIILLWIVAFFYAGLYNRSKKSIMPEIDEFIKIFAGVSIAVIEVIVLSFLYKDIPDSRYVIFYSWLFGLIIISFSRLIILKVELLLLKKGVGARSALVIGTSPIGQDVAERIVTIPTLGYSYKGSLSEGVPEAVHYHLRKKLKVLCRPEEFMNVFEKRNIDVVFYTLDHRDYPWYSDLVRYCEEKNIILNVISEFSGMLSTTVSIENFDGIPFLKYEKLGKLNVSRFLKRIFDISSSLVFIALLSPLLIFISLLIKIVSPFGPVIYSQERVGLNNSKFNMFKFRTMVPDAENKSGPVMVSEQDVRYIPFGRLLRKYSLDELPQFFNVLFGDMSMVGPRPERPFFVKQFNKEIPFFNLRHLVKGGITGWAQINGRAVLTHRPDHKIKYDLYYIKNWSLLLDIKIFIKTILMVLKGDEAY
jgi:exopolysaccharide biosynthesis polyprenyl glycosylphosphotransferase